jgi:hypothetical protein
MAFLKQACALITKPSIQLDGWGQLRRANSKQSAATVEASLMKLADFHPDEYLFTHATIISSVATQPGQDWLITPETRHLVNDNGDCWSRDVTRASYHTFRGAENYLEHVQIKELSKGKVLDAALRNLGDHDYVDILVATHRKHEDVINRIASRDLNAMSMGAVVAFTICSKCGNRAADEVSLCNHIKYEKGQEWVDDQGRTSIVAELCGHADTPDSNIFIEASWVKNPAFGGAVLHNVLEVTAPITASIERPDSWQGKGTSTKSAAFLDEEALKRKRLKERQKNPEALGTRDNENLISAGVSDNALMEQVIRFASVEGWRKAARVYQTQTIFRALAEADRQRGDMRLSRRAYAALSQCWETIPQVGVAKLEQVMGRALTATETERVREVITLL